MEIDKLQLLILTILEESGATTPGTGMTLKEISNEVNDGGDHLYAQITINRKVHALRDGGYITSKMKTNRADMFYILDKGENIREVLLNGK